MAPWSLLSERMNAVALVTWSVHHYKTLLLASWKSTPWIQGEEPCHKLLNSYYQSFWATELKLLNIESEEIHISTYNNRKYKPLALIRPSPPIPCVIQTSW